VTSSQFGGASSVPPGPAGRNHFARIGRLADLICLVIPAS